LNALFGDEPSPLHFIFQAAFGFCQGFSLKDKSRLIWNGKGSLKPAPPFSDCRLNSGLQTFTASPQSL
jgi:hypothetical protein